MTALKSENDEVKMEEGRIDITFCSKIKKEYEDISPFKEDFCTTKKDIGSSACISTDYIPDSSSFTDKELHHSIDIKFEKDLSENEWNSNYDQYINSPVDSYVKEQSAPILNLMRKVEPVGSNFESCKSEVLSCFSTSNETNSVAPVCQKFSDSKILFNLLSKKQDQTKPLQCSFCNAKFEKLCRLEVHQPGHLNERRFKYVCGVCKNSLKSRVLLKSHLKSHDEFRPFECPACPAKFKRLLGLRIHKKKHVNEGQFKFTERFSTDYNLEKHSETHLLKKEIYTCGVCKKSYKNKTSLKTHLKNHDPSLLHQCEICDAKFDRITRLKIHQAAHANERQFKCTLCPKAFNHGKYLKTHLQSHNLERKEYVCDVCYKSFNLKASLKLHLQVHNEIRTFKCQICPSAFKRKGDLRIHQDAHANKKRFKCYICPKSFNYNSSLKCHVASHTDHREYVCDTCKKSFNSKVSLRTHLICHNESRPYQCTLCPAKFKRLLNLKDHQAVHKNKRCFM